MNSNSFLSVCAGFALVVSTASAATFTYTGGTFVPGTTAPEPLTSPDVLNINAGASKIFDATTFTNQSGTVNWNANTLFMQNGAIINNQALWDAKSNDSIVQNAGATATFNNSGTFRKSAGTGTTTIGGIAFVNSGTIDAQTGTINFSGGNATFNAGTQFTGAGATTVSNNAAFNGALTSTNLSLTGGTFTGTSAQINGTVNYNGGSLAGTWSVNTGQALNGLGGGSKILDGVTLTNNGTFTWQTTNAMFMQNGASVVNNGLHDIQSTSTIAQNAGALSTYTNGSTGTLRVGNGATATIGTIAFVNNGGTLESNGTLNFSGGNATFNAGTQFTGTGSTTVSNSAAFNGAFTSTNLSLTGGNFTGTAAQINGTVNYTGGSLMGTWSVNTNQTLNGLGGGSKILDGVALTNNGTFTWQTTNAMFMQNGASMVNNGLHDIQSTSSIVQNAGALSTYTNGSTGTLRVANGATATIGTIAFVNNGGTLESNGTLTFNGGNATFNAGTQFTGTGSTTVNSTAAFNGAFTSSNLSLTNGTFTGSSAQINGTVAYEGGTMTGTWSVASGATVNGSGGASKILDAVTFTNQGTLNWQTTNTLFMQNGTTLNNAGLLDFKADASIAYNGGAQTAIVNTGTLRKSAGVGTSQIGVPVTNNGVIDAQSGRLFFSTATGIQGTGTLQIGTSGAVTLGGNSTVGVLTHGGGSASALTLNANTITVSSDYTNANFGVGNTFNRRANVSVTGAGNRIIAAGDTNQGLSGTAMTNGGTTTPSMTIGNVRVGGTTFNYNIDNTGTSGPSLRGAIQTSVNGANLNDARLSGTGVTAGNWGAVATGTSLSRDVTFTVNSAGVFAPLAGQSVNIPNNFDNTRAQLLTINSAAGAAAYQPAQASTLPTPVNLGNVRINGTLNTNLNITNVAPNTGGFTETLGASVTGTTGGVTTSGSVSGLVQGASSTAISAGFNTATAGARNGTAIIAFTSSEINGSGLGTIGVGNQTVTLTGGVYQPAVANALSTPVNVGNARVGGTLSTTLGVTNTASGPAGFVETLGASVTGTTGGVQTAGTVSNLAAGASSNTISASFSTAAAGAKSGSATLGFTTNEVNSSDLGTAGIGSQTVNLTGGVYQPAVANTLSSPVNVGNARVGGTLSTSLSIQNTASGPAGFVETLGASVTGTTGGVQTAGTVSNLAAGASSTAISASFSTVAAGAKSGSATIGFTTNEVNGSGLGTAAIGSQAVNLTGAVYQPAAANTLSTPVNVGNARVGGTLSTNLNISNVAPNTGGFTETLGATVTGTTGGVSTLGAVSGLAQGANSTAISASFNTATAGARSGSATVGFTSSEINGSGLGTIGVGSQTVNLTGGVYRLADPVLGTINFGNVLVGSSQSRFLNVLNNAPADGFSEGLNASLGTFSGASAGILSSNGGSITNLAAGASNNTALGVVLNTSSAGAVTANVQVLLASNGAGTSGLGLLTLPDGSAAISGLIQANVGNLASASAATPNPVNMGNVRVGAAAPSQALSIMNATAGPGEGLNASISTVTPGLTATGAFNNLAPGATNSSSLVVGMSTATAGSRNGTATIALASDGTFNGGVTTPLASQVVNVTGGVYQPAVANTLSTPVNVGNVRVGGTLSTTLGVTNTASGPAGFVETLGASVSNTTGGINVTGAPVSGLAAGASSNAMSAGFNTATAGARSGTATLAFTSSEVNGSGLGTIGIGSQTVTLNGAVYQPAVANALNTTVNLGTVRAGTVVNTTVGVTNTAPGTGGFTETLGASFGAASAGLAGSGSVTGLAAGSSSNAMSLQFTAGTPGAFSGSAAVNFVSQAINGSGLGDLSLASQTLNVSANVNALAVFGISNLSAFTFTPTGANSGTLDFGFLSSPSLLTASLQLSNSATAPSDSLLGNFNLAGLAGSPVSLTGASDYDLIAGAVRSFAVQFNPLSTGTFAATFALNNSSHNAFQSDLGLGTYTVTVRGQVGGGTASVPDSPIGWLGALTLLGTLAVGRWYGRMRDARGWV